VTPPAGRFRPTGRRAAPYRWSPADSLTDPRVVSIRGLFRPSRVSIVALAATIASRAVAVVAGVLGPVVLFERGRGVRRAWYLLRSGDHVDGAGGRRGDRRVSGRRRGVVRGPGSGRAVRGGRGGRAVGAGRVRAARAAEAGPAGDAEVGSRAGFGESDDVGADDLRPGDPDPAAPPRPSPIPSLNPPPVPSPNPPPARGVGPSPPGFCAPRSPRKRRDADRGRLH
jgi:hypothetical protein